MSTRSGSEAPPTPPVFPRILTDPALEVQPDWRVPPWSLAIITRDGEDLDEAVGRMSTAWQLHHETQQERWAKQQEDDRVRKAEEEAQREADREDETASNAKAAEEEASRQKLEKTKAVYPHQAEGKMVPTRVDGLVAPVHIDSLRAMRLVPLAHFLPINVKQASERMRADVNDGALTQIYTEDGRIVLRKAADLAVGKNVCADAQLSFGQVMLAKNTYIPALQRAGWRDVDIVAHERLFHLLDVHALRQDPNGDTILVRYLARARENWHAVVSLQRENPDISIINTELLLEVERDFEREEFRRLREVSLFHLYLISSLLTKPFPSFFPLSFSDALYADAIYADAISAPGQIYADAILPPRLRFRVRPLPLRLLSASPSAHVRSAAVKMTMI